MTKPLTTTHLHDPGVAPPDPAAPPDAALADPGAAWWVVSPTAVLGWSVAQTCSLTLALLQVPLAATYPTGAVLALEIMSAGQIGAAALLCPALFRTPATATVVLGSAWPALLLAGGIAARPVGQTALCGLVVSMWLATLFVWTSASHGRRWAQIVAAAATLFSVGGALLAYIAAEFAPSGEPASLLAQSLRATPMVLAWASSHSSTSAVDGRTFLLAMLVGGVIVQVVSHVRRRKTGSRSTAPR